VLREASHEQGFQGQNRDRRRIFSDLIAEAEKIDRGVIPEKTVERLSFPDLETKIIGELKTCTENFWS
jgi:hypothetical protein